MAKSAKRRQCPAVGRTITAAECGENRGSRYACPSDCIHNPFTTANYSQLLEIERLLDRKCMRALEEEAARGALPAELQRGWQTSLKPHEVLTFALWHLFFARDDAGSTCAQRWEQAGFPGFKNDERVLFRAKMKIEVALLEVQRVLDHQRVEMIDLLAGDPPPHTFVDRSLAAQAPRFGTYLCWQYPLPHLWRLEGTTIGLQELGPFSPAQVLDHVVRHLGSPTEDPDRRRWLAEHFSRVIAALEATVAARHQRMLADMDAQVGHATYELPAPFDATLVPPSLIEHPDRTICSSSVVVAPPQGGDPASLLTTLPDQQDRAFLDDHVPALDHRTPREAARDPTLRPRLIQLLKARVRQTDVENLRTGSQRDINWLIRELGLHEIDFQPPPLRAPPEAEDDEPDTAPGLPVDSGNVLALPPSALTPTEANQRLIAGSGRFETARAALEAVSPGGQTLLRALDQLLVGLLDDAAYSILLPFLIQIWHALVPPGLDPPGLDLDDLLARLETDLHFLVESIRDGGPDSLDRFVRASAQPSLLLLQANRLAEVYDRIPTKDRPPPHKLGHMMGVMKTMVDTVDGALRRGPP